MQDIVQEQQDESVQLDLLLKIRAKRKYFVIKHANYVSNYHKNLLKNVKGLLSIMGLKNIKQLDKK